MFDYGWQGEQAYKTGIYSEHKAKLIAWHRHYQTFYKESLLFCDMVFAELHNSARADGDGATPEAEPVFYNAVTGKNISFADGIEIGRRAWNLKRAILVLQGRTREMEKFSGYMYRPGAAYPMGEFPVYDGSKWEWLPCTEMYLDKRGVEQWKTAFYTVEGWDTQTGFPSRKTLEDLGLKQAADMLEARNKLG
jgi:aldehyde:ferredoxin oxidoreductase